MSPGPSADYDARVCGTCGMTVEPPDEPIEPGDAWMLDVARDQRCPECWQFPPRVLPPVRVDQ